MNNKVLYLVLAITTVILASCGSTSYYSSTTYGDGIYYRPTRASREAIVTNNQMEYYQRNRTLDSYFEVDTATGRVYLAKGVSYSDLLRKFDSPTYVFSCNLGWYDPWYNPWWGSWRYSWCDPWWGPMPYHPWYGPWYRPWPYDPWYRPYDPWYRPHPYHPGGYYVNTNVVYGKRNENGSVSGGYNPYSTSSHRSADEFYNYGSNNRSYSGSRSSSTSSGTASQQSGGGRRYSGNNSNSGRYDGGGHRSSSSYSSGSYGGGYSGGGYSGGGHSGGGFGGGGSHGGGGGGRR